MANIVFVDARLSPNPIKTNGDYKISVEIIDKVYGILTKSDNLILTKDGLAIERKGEYDG